MKKTLIFIPTYNESENINLLVAQILALKIDLDILFMDDNSPDGSGELLDSLANKYANLKVIHRTGKLGIGSAHKEGIEYSYKNNYQLLITMDCDFSHPPEFIPNLIENLKEFHIVLGSRYLRQDSLKDWNLLRKTLTYTGHFLTKFLLGMNYDATNAFRIYNLEKIPWRIFKKIDSISYSFFFESLFVIHLNQLTIGEIPIYLPKRTYGHSKMSYKDVVRSLMLLVELFIKKIFYRKRYIL